MTGQVVNRKFINDLPLVDRYVLDFVSLGPGVTNMSDQNSVGDTGTNFVSNGSRGASADILMDGASITNFEPNGGITNVTYTPSAEAVEEFKVEQTNFSAEYGFSGASVVNMITRSGGNSFHGSAYDFIRNQITDANNWFANAADNPIPPVHRNNYGGTIGGPIIKNKMFFFFDWDGTRSSYMSTYQAGVPSAAERTGNFGELCAVNGGTFNGCRSVQRGCRTDLGSLYCPAHYQAPPMATAGRLPQHLYSVQQPGDLHQSWKSQSERHALSIVADTGEPDRSGGAEDDESVPDAELRGGNGIYDNWIATGSNGRVPTTSSTSRSTTASTKRIC